MAHHRPSCRAVRWGSFPSILFSLVFVWLTPARAEPIDPFVLPATIVTVGGDPGFRGTIGYEITLSQPQNLSNLGFWDFLEDGLLSDHSVSLFADSATLLATAVVPAGTGARLENGFRWVSIPVLPLAPGRYVIGASMNGDPSTFDEVVTEASSILTMIGLTFGPDTALRSTPVPSGASIASDLMPALVDGGGGYFGPALAPGPLPLLGAGAGWAWSRRLRARCRQRDGVGRCT
ncbi:MAG: hypothetical protein VKM17_04825 [Cyanobacteriota bacterium]|nr:hypothetical protein [Cyanobacteriota bacterium]